MMRRIRLQVSVVACASVLLALAACESSNSGGSGSNGGGTGSHLPLTTLGADDFHAIGVAAAAPPLARGETVAQALGASTSNVRSYLGAICTGANPILLPTLIAFPRQVAAYEEVFAQAQRECAGTPTDGLDRARGRVANSMISSQDFLNRLNGTSSDAVKTFCDSLEKYERIDAKLIAVAAGKLGANESAASLLEFGVEILIKNCAPLLDRVTE